MSKTKTAPPVGAPSPAAQAAAWISQAGVRVTGEQVQSIAIAAAALSLSGASDGERMTYAHHKIASLGLSLADAEVRALLALYVLAVERTS